MDVPVEVKVLILTCKCLYVPTIELKVTALELEAFTVAIDS